MNKHLLKLTLNFLAVILLISLIATPFFFAKDLAKVAGVKSTSKFLVVSQIEKFPNLTLNQEGSKYQISFTKQGLSQAFLSVLIINNPTNTTQTYSLELISGQAKLFFGEDLNSQTTQISVPSSASVPMSLFSSSEILNQTVEFVITAGSE